MEFTSKFFCNTNCEYYPCHEGIEDFNCLFCYCPLYPLENCSGNFTMTEIGGKKIKDCSNCVFPHIPQNHDKIMAILKTKGE